MMVERCFRRLVIKWLYKCKLNKIYEQTTHSISQENLYGIIDALVPYLYSDELM